MTAMQESPSAAANSKAGSEYMKLKDFLTKFGISYSTYRRLRLANKAPQERKLTKKTILLRRETVAEWERDVLPTLFLTP